MLYNEKRITPVVSKRPRVHGLVTKTITYENNTGMAICVTESSGAHFMLASERTHASPAPLVVYVTYRAPIGTCNMLGLSEQLPPAVYRDVCEELEKTGESTLTYIVDDPLPIMRGEAVIVKTLGLAFSLRPLRFENGTSVMEANTPRTTTLSMGVAVIQHPDDEKEYRWVRYYSSLVEVAPIRSRYYDPGVYMVLLSGEIVEEGRLLLFEFTDQLSPFRVFESEADARTFRWTTEALPDLKTVKERMEKQIELNAEALESKKAEMELSYKQRLAELSLEKEQTTVLFKRLDLEIKNAQERLKEEYELRAAIRKEQSEERKQQMDERSLNRKDGSELLKSLPTYLAAGMAILAMVV